MRLPTNLSALSETADKFVGGRSHGEICLKNSAISDTLRISAVEKMTEDFDTYQDTQFTAEIRFDLNPVSCLLEPSRSL
jgi:hypothetical protein